MTKPKIKICGITSLPDALHAVWAGADALGFVFYAQSPRWITPQQAKRIIDILPPWIITVGLFVNEDISRIKKIARVCRLDFLQLHGDETVSYVKNLAGFRLIKAIRIKDKRALETAERFPVEVLLLDAFSKSGYGGTGKKFDWNFSPVIKKIKKPYIISGGLTPANVRSALRRFRPYAVDVSSGVEIKPGKKNKRLLKEFIDNVRN